MAARSETLQLIIRAKDSASAALGRVNKALDSAMAPVQRLSGALFNLKTAFASLGAALVARDFLKTADSFERYRTQLVTVAGSAEKAESAMQWITDFTAKTPYELDQVTASFAKLSAYGIDPADGKLRVLGDTAAAMGKSLDQAVEMFADAATGEFERLKEFGIRASQEGDKVTFRWMQNGQQMVQEAQKTQEGISTALTDILSQRFSGAMERYSATWSGMMSNLKDQWTLFQKDVMEGGVFDFLKTGLSLVLKYVNDLREKGKLKEWAEEAANGVIRAFEKMMLGAATFYDGTAPIIKRISEALGQIWKTFKDLPSWVQTSGLIAAILGGRAAAAGLAGVLYLVDETKNQVKALKAVFEDKIDWEDYFAWQNFQMTTDDLMKKIEETSESGGQVIRQKIIPPVKDLTEALNKAGSATEKVKVLLQYLRQLRGGQAASAPGGETGGFGGGGGIPSTIEAVGSEKENKSAWEARNKALGEWNKSQLAIYEMEQKAIEDQAEAEETNAKQSMDRAKALADMKLRVQRQLATDMQSQAQVELAEMDQRHQQEIDRLRQLNATKTEIDEAYRLQKSEKDQLMLDQERKAQLSRLEMASSVAGGMANAFTQLYELSGKKQKEWFYLAKAAAIAQAVINVAEGVTKALAQGGMFGPIMAGVVAASGAAQIATIVAQRMAGGGLIQSGSGHKDDVPALLMRGEYVIRKRAVDAIGLRTLNAINSLAVPRFQEGGMVAAAPAGDSYGMASGHGGMTIANFIDPALFERFIYSARGQKAVVNVISAQSASVQRIMRG